MFERKNIQPEKLFKRAIGGLILYSPVVSITSGVPGSKFVWISGLLSRDVQGNIIGKGDMAKQIQQVGENLQIALESADARLSDLVRTCTYTTDIDEFFKHTEIRHEYLGKYMPTSTTVEVRRLSHPDFLVEIEATAVIPIK